MNPPPQHVVAGEVLFVQLVGLALATMVLFSALAVGKAAWRRHRGRPWRRPPLPMGLRSLAGLVAVAALIGGASEVRTEGLRPGWRAVALGWHVGGYVDLTQINYRVSFGPGDPRVGLRCDFASMGRSILYVGMEGRR